MCSELWPLLNEENNVSGQSLSQRLDQTLQERERNLLALKDPWPAWADELQVLHDKQVNGKIQARWYHPWPEKLRSWAGGDAAGLDLATGFTRLTPDGMAIAWKGSTPLPQHPAFDAMVTLEGQLTD